MQNTKMQRRTPKTSKLASPSPPPVICTSCAEPMNFERGFSCNQDKYMCLPCYFK